MKLFNIYNEIGLVNTVIFVDEKKAVRIKKTEHAKIRKERIKKERELRKYPYSAMLGKGKGHDHHWLNESAIIETRCKAKVKSEFKDYFTI